MTRTTGGNKPAAIVGQSSSPSSLSSLLFPNVFCISLSSLSLFLSVCQEHWLPVIRPNTWEEDASAAWNLKRGVQTICQFVNLVLFNWWLTCNRKTGTASSPLHALLVCSYTMYVHIVPAHTANALVCRLSHSLPTWTLSWPSRRNNRPRFSFCQHVGGPKSSGGRVQKKMNKKVYLDQKIKTIFPETSQMLTRRTLTVKGEWREGQFPGGRMSVLKWWKKEIR